MPDRIIKESICTSETLNQLTDFEERFWFRLTVNCDDYGRFDARPAILKGRLFPLMESKTLKNIADTLSRLASVGLISLYEVEGRPFLQVVTWEKHQRIRAQRSKFPSPDNACRQSTADDGKCPRNPIQSESESNPNPSESGAENRPRGPFIPPSLEEVFAYCRERKNDVSPQKFFDYFQASGWVDAKGNKVKNWKQKLISWEGRDNGKNSGNHSAAPANGGDWGIQPDLTAGD